MAFPINWVEGLREKVKEYYAGKFKELEFGVGQPEQPWSKPIQDALYRVFKTKKNSRYVSPNNQEMQGLVANYLSALYYAGEKQLDPQNVVIAATSTQNFASWLINSVDNKREPNRLLMVEYGLGYNAYRPVINKFCPRARVFTIAGDKENAYLPTAEQVIEIFNLNKEEALQRFPELREKVGFLDFKKLGDLFGGLITYKGNNPTAVQETTRMQDEMTKVCDYVAKHTKGECKVMNDDPYALLAVDDLPSFMPNLSDGATEGTTIVGTFSKPLRFIGFGFSYSGNNETTKQIAETITPFALTGNDWGVDFAKEILPPLTEEMLIYQRFLKDGGRTRDFDFSQTPILEGIKKGHAIDLEKQLAIQIGVANVLDNYGLKGKEAFPIEHNSAMYILFHLAEVLKGKKFKDDFLICGEYKVADVFPEGIKTDHDVVKLLDLVCPELGYKIVSRPSSGSGGQSEDGAVRFRVTDSPENYAALVNIVMPELLERGFGLKPINKVPENGYFEDARKKARGKMKDEFGVEPVPDSYLQELRDYDPSKGDIGYKSFVSVVKREDAHVSSTSKSASTFVYHLQEAAPTINIAVQPQV